MKTAQAIHRARRQKVGYRTLARFAFHILWDASRLWTAVWLTATLLLGFLPPASIYLLKWLVDVLAESIGAGWDRDALDALAVPALLFGAVLLSQRVLQGLAAWTALMQSELVQDHVKEIIHKKAAAVDFEVYETPGYYDLLERVNTQGSARILSLLQGGAGFAQATITFSLIGALLAGYGIWVPLLLLAGTLPTFLILLRHEKQNHDWWNETTADRRWAQYNDQMLGLQLAAAEVRLNRLGDYFTSNYQAVRRVLREGRMRLYRRQAVARMGAGFMGVGVVAATMSWIIVRAVNGLATIGDIALFFQSFNRGQVLMGTWFRSVGTLFADALFLRHLHEFTSLPNRVVNPLHPRAFPSKPVEGIRFRHLTFTYPGSERPAIRDFSLEIPSNSVVALVGENGAGKSTLIKLLCRFYDPDEGSVEIDGVDLREYRQEDLRKNLSVMFQFPLKFQLKASTNIELGDLQGSHSLEDVEIAARAAGAHTTIQALPRRYDTLLGRMFEGGVELSGGEWQRVALARAFVKRAPIIVLDEPTSAMDSWSENDWLLRFRTLVQGRTALVITHRLSVAMKADLIHVMEKGRIVESGTHSELLAADGRYARSWVEQLQVEGSLILPGAA